jgi:hypothetical protein
MIFTKFATLVRYYTKTNSTTFTDADILILANIFKEDIAGLIAKEVGEDYVGLRFERDLIAGQREYDLPAEVMGRIKYLEAKLDGTNWQHLKETDLSLYGKSTDEDTIQLTYSEKDPEYDIWDQSIFILSGDAIINVREDEEGESGLKLWSIIYPADFTDLTSTEDMSVNPDDYSHGFPRQFHELLARRVSIAYKSSKDRPIPLSEKEKLYEVDLATVIQSMKDANLDRSVIPSASRKDGSEY